MNWWLVISTGLALLAWTILVIWYWIRAKWWKTFMGQNMMGLSILVALSLGLRLVNQVVTPREDYRPWQVILGVAIYGLLAFFGFQRVYFVEQSQREVQAARAWRLYTRGTPPGLQNGD